MKRVLITALLATCAAGAHAATVFGVDENNNLVRFDSANPGVTLSSVRITGTDESFQALDFRPINNTLYGLGSDRGLYAINTSTGLATQIGGTLAIEGSQFGFDFNPTIDRIRIVSNLNDNYVVNPDTGAIQLVATDVSYGPTGPNPAVTANAYTSSTFGAPAASTQLYAIDAGRDLLATQANNAGTLVPVGSLGVDLGNRTSFDISGSDAFVQNGTNFYSVNLGTGALTRIGATDRSLFGIAIAPTAAVPEPATWATMIMGFGLIGLGLRRRTAVKARVRFV